MHGGLAGWCRVQYLHQLLRRSDSLQANPPFLSCPTGLLKPPTNLCVFCPDPAELLQSCSHEPFDRGCLRIALTCYSLGGKEDKYRMRPDATVHNLSEMLQRQVVSMHLGNAQLLRFPPGEQDNLGPLFRFHVSLCEGR